MTAFVLRIIACVTMLIDHIGYVFEDELAAVDPLLPVIFRLIGRIAFPLFAFGIAEGVTHTSSPKKYLLRMLLFAVISQLPFMLMIGTQNATYSISLFSREIGLYGGLSVMVTLFLGLCICVSIHEGQHLGAALALAAGYILDTRIGMDYGLLGILFVAALYFARQNKLLRSLVMVLFAVCFYLTPLTQLFKDIVGGVRPLTFGVRFYYFLGMCVPAVLLLFYNGKKGPRFKLLNYAFYPVHMLIIWFIWAIKDVFALL